MVEEEQSHILVVDDDARLRSLLQRFLRESGYYVSVAEGAEAARNLLAQYKFDLLIVDIMMPGETGLQFLARLRQESRVPVILLTAMGETADRIAGLKLGADDYLPKPFEPEELLLRLKNILKREPKIKIVETVTFDFGTCIYHSEKKELTDMQGKIIHMTPVEQTLLNILTDKLGQIFSREELADMLGAGQSPRSIDVQITRLRKKLEPDSKNPKYLRTVRGKGYMLLCQ